MPVIHTNVLISPKKNCFVLYQILQYVYFFYVVVNNQTPSLRQGSLLRDNINIFMNVTYLNMFHICIYKVYSMISLLCTKVKFI